MGKKHDDIVCSLDKKRIIELFGERLFGEKGNWSPAFFHKLCEDYIDNEDDDDNCSFKIYRCRHYDYNEMPWQTPYDDMKVSDAMKQIKEDYNTITTMSIINSFNVKIEHEYLITKGDGKYKTEIGYLDIVCTIEPTEIGAFSCYEKSDKIRIIIDAKPIEEFEKDTGAIIRQIKRYKEFYQYSTDMWVIYSDKQPPESRVKYIEQNNIICMWDDEIKEGDEGDGEV